MSTTTDLTSAALAAALDGPPFVAPLPHTAVLALAGSDARGFLHGQLANDVNGLASGEAGRSLLLNHKGHAMAEAAVVRTEADMLCVVDDDKLAWVEDTLERHIVFDDVQLSRPNAAALTLQGARAAEVLEAAGFAAPAGSGWDRLGAGWGERSLVYRTRRSEAGGFDMVVFGEPGSRPLVDALVAAGAVQVGAQERAAARVVAAISTAGHEGGEGVLPQEAGLTQLLSYRKGCYLGQEIMARIEARGTLRRGLATLELEAVPEPDLVMESGRSIMHDGRTVGVLGSSARLPDGSVRALGVLRGDLPSGALLSVAGVAGRRLMHAAPIMPA